MRISDWSSDVCSSDLAASGGALNVPTLEAALGARDGDPVQYIDSFFRSGDGFDEAYRLKNTSWSIFGTLDFDITDRLTFTVGAHYTQDRKRFSTAVVSTDNFSANALDAPNYAPFSKQLLTG